MATTHSDRSIQGILVELVTQFSLLVRKEGELARAEMSEKIGQVWSGLAFIIGGAVVLMPAMVILLEAATQGLQQAGLASYWSSLAVGGAVFLLGLILLMFGASRLRAENLIPKKTIHQLQEGVAVIRREARSANDYERAA